MIKNLVMLLGLNGESDSLYFHYNSAIDRIVDKKVNDSVLVVDYDIDRNGISETTAYFKITDKYLNEAIIIEYAFKLEISCDGKSKLVLEDLNNDSFLEKISRENIDTKR